MKADPFFEAKKRVNKSLFVRFAGEADLWGRLKWSSFSRIFLNCKFVMDISNNN